MEKFRYVFWIAYDGSSFFGWQTQKDFVRFPTIQDALERALSKVHGGQQRICVTGSGRTDRGVHASFQVAHADLPKQWEWFRLQKALHFYLPHSIRIWRMKQVPFSFHARKSVLKKKYCYYLFQGAVLFPWFQKWVWHVPYRFDPERIQKGCALLKGTHDFFAFADQDGSTKAHTVRTLFQVSFDRVSMGSVPFGRSMDAVGGLVSEKKGENALWRFQWVGSGFLKHMVRSAVGTLVEVGRGKKSLGELLKALQTKDRTLVGPTVSAQGLWLEQVWYPSFSLENNRFD